MALVLFVAFAATNTIIVDALAATFPILKDSPNYLWTAATVVAAVVGSFYFLEGRLRRALR